MEFLRKGILTKRQTVNGQNQELVTTELNIQHPLVLKALPGLLADTDDLLDDEPDDDDDPGEETGLPEETVSTATAEGNGSSRDAGSYHRRFSSGTGRWRGRSNVRSGSGLA